MSITKNYSDYLDACCDVWTLGMIHFGLWWLIYLQVFFNKVYKNLETRMESRERIFNINKIIYIMNKIIWIRNSYIVNSKPTKINIYI